MSCTNMELESMPPVTVSHGGSPEKAESQATVDEPGDEPRDRTTAAGDRARGEGAEVRAEEALHALRLTRTELIKLRVRQPHYNVVHELGPHRQQLRASDVPLVELAMASEETRWPR